MWRVSRVAIVCLLAGGMPATANDGTDGAAEPKVEILPRTELLYISESWRANPRVEF